MTLVSSDDFKFGMRHIFGYLGNDVRSRLFLQLLPLLTGHRPCVSPEGAEHAHFIQGRGTSFELRPRKPLIEVNALFNR